MSIGMGELLLILVIVFVLFGAGKLPQVMNDLGKGIKGLKKGMRDEDDSKNQQKITGQNDQIASETTTNSVEKQ